jgi:hypothetical protein
MASDSTLVADADRYRRLGYEPVPGTEPFHDLKRVKPEYHGTIGFVLMRKRLSPSP